MNLALGLSGITEVDVASVLRRILAGMTLRVNRRAGSTMRIWDQVVEHSDRVRDLLEPGYQTRAYDADWDRVAERRNRVRNLLEPGYQVWAYEVE